MKWFQLTTPFKTGPVWREDRGETGEALPTLLSSHPSLMQGSDPPETTDL
jgi:hypothetical protein